MNECKSEGTATTIQNLLLSTMRTEDRNCGIFDTVVSFVDKIIIEYSGRTARTSSHDVGRDDTIERFRNYSIIIDEKGGLRIKNDSSSFFFFFCVLSLCLSLYSSHLFDVLCAWSVFRKGLMSRHVKS
jgi:hypothetical protein